MLYLFQHGKIFSDKLKLKKSSIIAEPHTHMGQKEKPMNRFSHGFYGYRYCSWALAHDDDGGGRVAQHGGHKWDT